MFVPQSFRSHRTPTDRSARRGRTCGAAEVMQQIMLLHEPPLRQTLEQVVPVLAGGNLNHELDLDRRH